MNPAAARTSIRVGCADVAVSRDCGVEVRLKGLLLVRGWVTPAFDPPPRRSCAFSTDIDPDCEASVRLLQTAPSRAGRRLSASPER